MSKKSTSGQFAPGPDPRRHTFTEEERRRGYRTTLARYWDPDDPPLWLLYQAKRARDASRRPRHGPGETA